MKKLTEILINPDKISKIFISREEKRLYYRINTSLFSTLPIFNWFVPSIKVYVKGEENKEILVEDFSSYDSFRLWARNNEFSFDTIPSAEIFWSQEGEILLRKKPYLIFYGLDGLDMGKMEFKSQDAMNKALEELKRLRFIHISDSR
jgi:hypothetical protein